MKQFDPRRPAFSPYGFSCELWKPVRMSKPDRHNEIELNLMLGGSITYLLGGRGTTVSSGQLAIFWAAIPHQIVDFESTAPYFVLTVPLAEFLQIGIERQLIRRILQGELLVDDATIASEEPVFHRWSRDLSEDNPVLTQAAKWEVLARLLRLSQRIGGCETQNFPPALKRADQLACHIALNYQRPLNAQTIAEAVGLHANYAMNLFRSAFGTTMTAFIVQHRISHAQRLLVTTDEPIVGIALDAGFQSISRFNEAFKEACGCSPRDYRKEHRR